MPFSLPSDPSDGQVAPASWGDAVRAGLSYLANPPACRVYHNTTQSIAEASLVKPVFNSERYDTAGMHSTSVNTGRITIVDAGLYLVTFTAVFASGSDYVRVYADLFVNNATQIALDDKATPAVAHSPAVAVSTVYKFAAADYVEPRVYHDNTANTARNLLNVGNYSPEFSATWIGLG